MLRERVSEFGAQAESPKTCTQLSALNLKLWSLKVLINHPLIPSRERISKCRITSLSTLRSALDERVQINLTRCYALLFTS